MELKIESSQKEEEVFVNCPKDISSLKSPKDVLKLMETFNKTEKGCCQPRIPLEKLNIKDIVPSYCHRYALESLWESRSIYSQSAPCLPPVLLYSSNGPSTVAVLPTGEDPNSPFNIWEVPLPHSEGTLVHSFVPRKTTTKILNSERIRPCTNCGGVGLETCGDCSGLGVMSCIWCKGSGRREVPFSRSNGNVEFKGCNSCNGAGRRVCGMCVSGQVKCRRCEGLRFMKEWEVLTVEWTTTTESFFTDEGATDRLGEKEKKYLEKEKEEWFFENEWGVGDLKVLRVEGCHSLGIVASREMRKQTGVRSVRSGRVGRNEVKRVVQFKHKVGVVPVVKVIVELKGKEFIVNVVGYGNKMFWVGGYPAKYFKRGKCGCTCCCLIM